MTITAIIPARKGSKGIPGKNVVDFHGHPLIAWTILAARESQLFDHIVVSTDCFDIAEKAQLYRAETPYRPAWLSGDAAPTDQVVRHVLGQVHCQTAVLLQPTSPLRTANDIRAAYALHIQHGRPVVSFTPAKPWLFVHEGDRVSNITEAVGNRQSCSTLRPNGAIYIASATHLSRGGSWYDDPVPYIMPDERSIDIDTPLDLELARLVFEQQGDRFGG